MKKIIYFFFVYILFLILVAPAKGQPHSVVARALADTVININEPLKSLSKTNVGNLAAKQVGTVKNTINNKFNLAKKSPVSLDLVIENAARFNPVSAYTGLSAPQKLANVVNIRGSIVLYGVPLAVDYSTQPQITGTAPLLNNGLFKFDLDPKRLSAGLMNEMDRFRAISKNAFGGMNIDDYTKRILQEQVSRGQENVKSKVAGNLLSGYLSQPGKVRELLALSRVDIRQKISDEITRQKLTTLVSSPQGISLSALQKGVSPDAWLKLDKLKSQQLAITSLGTVPAINSYFTDPANSQQLRLMNEEQFVQKIEQLSTQGNPVMEKPLMPGYLIPVKGFNAEALISHVLTVNNNAQSEARQALAKQLMLSARQNNKIDFANILAGQQKLIQQQNMDVLQAFYLSAQVKPPDDMRRLAMSKLDRQQLMLATDSVAGTIIQLQNDLASKGIDIKHVLSIQSYLDKKESNEDLSEFGKSLYEQTPGSLPMSLLSKFSALKIGSFSAQPSSLSNGKEIFMQGAHIKLKTGLYPLTVGYGSVGDLNAYKDNAFSSSVYNQPRKVSYIGTEIKSPTGGGFKFTVISSLNSGLTNRNYALPAISSNNVAMTVSKMLKMGQAGELNLDASKSTTLYSNKYQIGTDVMLERKGGLNYNAGADLFSAISLGANHRLELDKAGLSENIYVSYSGMGYQNPGMNGPGGARTKFGGQLKKAFMNNRLMINVRSDFNRMPISYTSNDQWKASQFQIDGRYMLSKRFSLGGRYIRNNTDKQIDNVSSSVYQFDKLQLDGNANYKIGRYFSVSRFTIANQVISNTYVSGTGARLLMANYTQSVVIRKNVLTANLFLNKEYSATSIIGNMLNSDLAYQYSLSKKFNMSSGLTYLDNTRVVRQAGIRQSLNFKANERFTLSSFIDVRKNMIRPLYPDLYAAYRAEVSLQYRINY